MKGAIIFLFLMISSLQGQAVLGVWQTVDDTDGNPKSHVEISINDGVLYAKVVKLLPAAEGTHCKKCKGELKDKPILGLQVIEGMKEKRNEWKGGYILDPATGKEYKCLITFKDKNTLKVRGYIGAPLLGRTQLWTRVQ